MSSKNFPIVLLACLFAACATTRPSFDALTEFQKRAARYDGIVTVPAFETSPGEVQAAVEQAIAMGVAALDRIGALEPGAVSFENTVRAIDDLGFQIGLVSSRVWLIKETGTDPALRETATASAKQLQQWMVGAQYREDVYKSVKAFADTRPPLEGEDAKLLEETMRDYRRAGFELPKAERDEVERMRKELARLSTDFRTNINKAQKPLLFTRAQLEGVPEDFLAQIKTGENEYTVMANITWHSLQVMENARSEDTRRQLYIARHNLARQQNVPLLEKILALRADIAGKLGYDSWADYRTETRMAKNAATAIRFLEDLRAGLQPKFDAELEQFRQLKIEETGDADAQICIWDWRYSENQFKKRNYNVDAEQLRVYFPYDRVLAGMFAIYQRIFGLKFEQVEPPQKWIDDLELYAVSDTQTGEPLGLFYLDMFPREGKFNHFAQFGLVAGKRLPDGRYQRPTVALICNFPAPMPDRPALLSHADVETLFHEFGHAMHSILTRAKYARFSGTSVPGDFGEAPSQMLEYWVWDNDVLDSFAGDYRDPSRKIPADVLAKLKEAKFATEATRYRRQLAFGLLDMALHTEIDRHNAAEALPLSNELLSEVFLPGAEEETAFVAYFGHLMGYDAGYYGYAWADAIAADMATAFEQAPDRFFDREAGLRLRKEIYEPGDSRDVNISIEKFLRRPRSLGPFLKKIGMENR
jgi:thimet oligopeptidase